MEVGEKEGTGQIGGGKRRDTGYPHSRKGQRRSKGVISQVSLKKDRLYKSFDSEKA